MIEWVFVVDLDKFIFDFSKKSSRKWLLGSWVPSWVQFWIFFYERNVCLAKHVYVPDSGQFLWVQWCWYLWFVMLILGKAVCASCGQYCVEFSLYLLYMAFSSFKIASLYGLMGQELVNSSCTIDSITDSQKGGKQWQRLTMIGNVFMHMGTPLWFGHHYLQGRQLMLSG